MDLTNAPVDDPVETPPVGSGLATDASRGLGSRFWKLCGALATAPVLARKRSIWGSGLLAIEHRTEQDDRSGGGLDLLESEVSATSATASKLVVSARGLPFRCDQMSLLAFGTGDSVFQLGAPEAELVCKVQRTSLGLPPRDLERIARKRREAFEQVLKDYAAVKNVFPEVRFLVANSPLFGVPAVMALQTFVPEPRRDLFREVPQAELRRLVSEVPALRAQVTDFFRSTIGAWRRGGWIVDLAPEKLVLAGEREETRLVYLDVEMKRVAALKGTIREGMYQVLMDRMVELLGSIDRD